ncbi:conserved hypothetical protein [Neospora caninum Liverpool]|uniref:Uncharacterized protein n=1 Tax=Neospora caninum (strain Liverpool) TaxID=572307 RepID=F0V8V6_NEOCL|nr:conserved hypothetical protein [Neospora caninum Liverpool]CBZ50147.1 conserved hypothetical protein [Neospora caninum Liverpool]|eukprot:XP_003880182.1 conserved hypothetical protein [Neospora caninum Liverpool]
MHKEYGAQPGVVSGRSPSFFQQPYSQEPDPQLSHYEHALEKTLQQRQQELQHELDLVEERVKIQSHSAQAEMGRQTDHRRSELHSLQGPLSQPYPGHMPHHEQLSEHPYLVRENPSQPDQRAPAERYGQSFHEAARTTPQTLEPTGKRAAEIGTATGQPDVFDEQVLEELRRTGKAVVHTTGGTYVFSPSEDGQTIHCAVYPPGTFESRGNELRFEEDARFPPSAALPGDSDWEGDGGYLFYPNGEFRDEEQRSYVERLHHLGQETRVLEAVELNVSADSRGLPSTSAPGIVATESPVEPFTTASASRYYTPETQEERFPTERPMVPSSSVGMGESIKGYPQYPKSGPEEYPELRWEQMQQPSNKAEEVTSNQRQAAHHILVPNSHQLQDNAPKLVEFCLDALESVGRPICKQGSYLSVAAYVHSVEENKPHLRTSPVPIDSNGCADFRGAPLQMIWRGEEFVHMKVYEERQYEAMGEAVGFLKLQFASLNAENAPMKVMLVGKENEPNGFLILRFSILGSLTSASSHSQGPFPVPALAVPQLGRSAGVSPVEAYSTRDNLPSYDPSNYAGTSPPSSAGPGNQLPTLPVGFLGQASEYQDLPPQYHVAHASAFASLTDAYGRGYAQETAPDARGIDRRAPIDGSSHGVEGQFKPEAAAMQTRVASPHLRGSPSLRLALPSPSSGSHHGVTEALDARGEQRVAPKKPGATAAQNPSKQVARRSLLQRWRRGWCCEMSTGADLN